MSSPWPYRPDLTDDALRAMREEATRELGLEEPDPEPAPRPKWLGFVAVEVAWLGSWPRSLERWRLCLRK